MTEVAEFLAAVLGAVPAAVLLSVVTVVGSLVAAIVVAGLALVGVSLNTRTAINNVRIQLAHATDDREKQLAHGTYERQCQLAHDAAERKAEREHDENEKRRQRVSELRRDVFLSAVVELGKFELAVMGMASRPLDDPETAKIGNLLAEPTKKVFLVASDPAAVLMLELNAAHVKFYLDSYIRLHPLQAIRASLERTTEAIDEFVNGGQADRVQLAWLQSERDELSDAVLASTLEHLQYVREQQGHIGALSRKLRHALRKDLDMGNDSLDFDERFAELDSQMQLEFDEFLSHIAMLSKPKPL